ncbi:S41 family peptidase, partial [Alienimonas sp. DA493]|uniref:S41 family peptidase n=1 Tax=Alienimonas sp. DA493 TaxID=3373605 RepID=UPI0037542986
GCLRDHGRGTIVGRTTYGKWSVQSIVDLGDAPRSAGRGAWAALERGGRGSGLKLTTARFYSPRGRNYAGLGLSPDVPTPEHADAPGEFDAGAGARPDAAAGPTGTPDDLFAAADPTAGLRGDRTSAYRPSRAARSADGPRVPQTSLPLHEQPDVQAALRLLRRR